VTIAPAYKKATQDFVAQVFNDYLIENYNVIVSGVYHSYGGMFMWQEQLGLAIQRRDRNVFLYDQLNASKTPITCLLIIFQPKNPSTLPFPCLNSSR
jgi:hypothetical protein